MFLAELRRMQQDTGTSIKELSAGLDQDTEKTTDQGRGPSASVAGVMMSSVPVARPESSIREIVLIMAGAGIDAVPVVDDENRLLGLVTQKTIAIRACAGDKSIEDIRARDAMSNDTTGISTADTISNALSLMVRRQASCLPVVDNDSRVVGMLGMAAIVSRGASRRDSRGAWLEVGYRAAVSRA
jgi:CBS domain-containing protein